MKLIEGSPARRIGIFCFIALIIAAASFAAAYLAPCHVRLAGLLRLSNPGHAWTLQAFWYGLLPFGVTFAAALAAGRWVGRDVRFAVLLFALMSSVANAVIRLVWLLVATLNNSGSRFSDPSLLCRPLGAILVAGVVVAVVLPILRRDLRPEGPEAVRTARAVLMPQGAWRLFALFFVLALLTLLVGDIRFDEGPRTHDSIDILAAVLPPMTFLVSVLALLIHVRRVGVVLVLSAALIEGFRILMAILTMTGRPGFVISIPHSGLAVACYGAILAFLAGALLWSVRHPAGAVVKPLPVSRGVWSWFLAHRVCLLLVVWAVALFVTGMLICKRNVSLSERVQGAFLAVPLVPTFPAGLFLWCGDAFKRTFGYHSENMMMLFGWGFYLILDLMVLIFHRRWLVNALVVVLVLALSLNAASCTVLFRGLDGIN